jgi:r1t holin
MFSKKWWQRAGERAAKTSAQVLILMLGQEWADYADRDWRFIGVSLIAAALLSLATSVITTPAGDDPTDPSVV